MKRSSYVLNRLLCAAILAGSLLTVIVRPASAQFLYDHTTFLHGFYSSGAIWTNTYPALGGQSPVNYLTQRVNLGNPDTPTLDYNQDYATQLGAFTSHLRSLGGQGVLVGHSLGGEEVRSTYLFNSDLQPHISGIITVATPHQGTWLANNSTAAAHFFTDVQRRVDDGGRAAKGVAILWVTLFAAVVTAVFHVSPNIITPLYAGIALFILAYPANTDLGLDQLYQLLGKPTIQDMAVGSATVNSLNANTTDAAIPRANVYATLPSFRNAAIYVKAQFSSDPDGTAASTIHQRDKGMSIFRACKVAGYVIIVGSFNARRCSFAAKALGRVDDEWMGFVNGYDSHGRPRAVPFDGVVSNENSHYPSPSGLSYDADVLGPNHENVYSRTDGLNTISQAMYAIGMQPAALTATIFGPSSLNQNYSAEWQARVVGGRSPYSYQWSGILSGNTEAVAGSPQSSGLLYLDVWSNDGQHVRTSLYVSIMVSCGGKTRC